MDTLNFKPLSRSLVTATVALALVGTVGTAEASMIYEETFPSGVAGNKPLSAINWDDSALHNTGQGGVRPDTIGGTNDPAVDSGDGVAPEDGNLWFNFSGPDTSAAYTEKWTISTAAPVTFEWYQRGHFQGRAFDVRIAVQVGGEWFASAAAASTPGEYTEWSLETLAYDPAAVNWLDLDLSSTDPSTGSAPANDLSGDVTGVGFFVERDLNAAGTVHIDQLKVTVIPEPGSLVMLGLGALAAFYRKR